MFEWLLAPFSLATFMNDIIDRHVLLVSRPHLPKYNLGCFGIADLWSLLESGRLRYGYNIDVTYFSKEKQRETFNYNSDPSVHGEQVPHLVDAPISQHSTPVDACRRAA
jgi:hypothetical protein